MAKHWIRLTNQAGEPHAWLNMAAVAAVHPDGRGGLRIEMIGEQGQDPARPTITRTADVAALLAYLEKMTRQMSRAQQRPDAAAALAAATGKQPPVARTAKARRASAVAHG